MGIWLRLAYCLDAKSRGSIVAGDRADVVVQDEGLVGCELVDV